LGRHRGEIRLFELGKGDNRKQGDASQTSKSGHPKLQVLGKMTKTRGNFCRGAEEEGANRGKAAGISPRGKLQQEKSRTIQANKTLEKSDRVLTAAIRRCHIEMAKRTSFSDIEASKDAVEAAWKEFTHASTKYCVRTGENLFGKEEELSEEARRVRYEWIALLNMMEQVVEKAEEYLESATKENSCGDHNDDGGDGGELDADEARRVIEAWMEQLSTMSKVNELALEVSAANEVKVNKVNEVVLEVSAVNKVNEECTMNKDSGEVCDAKEEMRKGKPPEVPQRSDVNAKAQTEMFGMKEVKNSKEDKEVERLSPLKDVKESRHANWDPGELVDVKAQIEMLDAKEEKINVNIGKVGLQLSMTEVRSSCGAIEKALLIVLFLLKERFVSRFRPDGPVEISDYG